MDFSKMQELLPNEVVTMEYGYYINNRPTSQISEIQKIINDRLGGDLRVLFSEEGLKCQVLRLGAPKWKSGRLRLTLLFEPDEPDEVESLTGNPDQPLDEIRRLADG
ncbi:hypothetical protein H6G52_09575 [Limnothrix sp. FACHB-881]|uniref:KGK domain-containing protein n=1 Tax=Limnothrix sp. FACHB-881 TaxID=2692819 RepID=UPI0016877552|nr:KGK domain-containing protein [Limnothrix sp. FACHB-881]MBD2635608.1 hypothetical protein [Limnothrix sp. FACHB-881]